ncbi:hypothetical protein JOQ06_028406 [Pogonophryne albipinna]|uniref:Uncharacterized protein n=1 Tax=Pogonophryne albipinna TaxID=1090488 RepID=A0AAD6FLR1_9TELE|nr:hypothetical protein JOQ06_028406 [Pogonophryne albipinna]
MKALYDIKTDRHISFWGDSQGCTGPRWDGSTGLTEQAGSAGIHPQHQPGNRGHLQDLSGSIDDLPTGTEGGLGSAVSVAGSTQSQHSRSGSGPISPASGPPANTSAPGSAMASQSSGNGPEGAHPPNTRSPMAQEKGFMSNMQRNQPGSQFASPQSGPPMSPHPSPGGPLYPGMGAYSQSGSSGSYGPQGSQYGNQG